MNRTTLNAARLAAASTVALIVLVSIGSAVVTLAVACAMAVPYCAVRPNSMATSKRGPHKPRKPIVVDWIPELDGRVRRHAASGMVASVISKAIGIPPRSIIRRLVVLRDGAAADTRRKSEDP